MPQATLHKNRMWLIVLMTLIAVSLACTIGGSTATPEPSAIAESSTQDVPQPYVRLGHAPNDAIGDGDTIRNCQSQPLEWPTRSGVSAYEIQIAANSDFAEPVIDMSVGPVAVDFQQYNIEDHRESFVYETLYYYRLRTRSGEDESDWSSSGTFRWPSPPSDAPLPLAPVSGAPVSSGTSVTVTYTYAQTAGDPFQGDCFYLQVASDDAFSTISHEMNFFAPSLTYAIPNLPDGTYFWHIAACNNAGPQVPTCGPFSTLNSFRVGATGAPASTHIPTSETQTPTSTTPTSPAPTASPEFLSFTWEATETGANPNNSREWLAVFAVTAMGGDGNYSYFHDALPVDGPSFEVRWEACKSKPGSITVTDGSGQSVEVKYFFEAPYCDKTPSP